MVEIMIHSYKGQKSEVKAGIASKVKSGIAQLMGEGVEEDAETWFVIARNADHASTFEVNAHLARVFMLASSTIDGVVVSTERII